MFSHQDVATETFNRCWTLLDQDQLDADQQRELERTAMASLYHWSVVGGAKEEAIGEWMVARVCVRLGFAEEAIRHAARAAEVVSEHGLGDYLVASTLEGLARAHALAGQLETATMLKEAAVRALDVISNEQDRALIERQIAEEPWFGVPAS
jgi:hypothetical protein